MDLRTLSPSPSMHREVMGDNVLRPTAYSMYVPPLAYVGRGSGPEDVVATASRCIDGVVDIILTSATYSHMCPHCNCWIKRPPKCCTESCQCCEAAGQDNEPIVWITISDARWSIGRNQHNINAASTPPSNSALCDMGGEKAERLHLSITAPNILPCTRMGTKCFFGQLRLTVFAG